jgi:hypothetical protein
MINASDVTVEPITIVVIINACGIGSTIAKATSEVMGMTPPFHVPKFKNNKINLWTKLPYIAGSQQ